MAKRKITLNVPADLFSNMQALGVSNPTQFLEELLAEIDAEDLVSLLEEEYWDEEDEEWDEDDEE